jgi:hypothetical protein
MKSRKNNKNFLLIMSIITSRKLGLTILILMAAIWNLPASAYVSSSTSYRLQYDSLNSEGLFSSSSSYNLEDTMGEVGTGESTSSNFNLKAGFQRLGDSTIAISSPSDIILSPDISGITGGAADGTLDWNVITDNIGGYTLNISASSSPAMSSGTNTFSDYSTTGADPDYDWSVATNAAEFGFTPEGPDIVNRFKDNGSDTCATGSDDTAFHCWDGLSTSDKTISQASIYNQPSGTSTTVRFRAESGYQKMQPPGTYAATIVATAISN